MMRPVSVALTHAGSTVPMAERISGRHTPATPARPIQAARFTVPTTPQANVRIAARSGGSSSTTARARAAVTAPPKAWAKDTYRSASTNSTETKSLAR